MNRHPIELIALDTPDDGTISGTDGVNDFWFQGVDDAIMSALAAGVDLVVPEAMFESIRDDFPPELPSYIKVSMKPSQSGTGRLCD
mgnify:CR=1 FL=1